MSKKPTWVEMLETSIEELKKEYDERFKELEERLTKSIATLERELIETLFALFPRKDEEIFHMYLDALKELLNKWKEISIMIFKEKKMLNGAVIFAKICGIESFEDMIKMLASKFSMEFIKESMTIEKVTEVYGVEGAKIFREFR